MVDFNAMTVSTSLVDEIEKNRDDYNQANIDSDDYDVLKKALRLKLYRYIKKANECDDFHKGKHPAKANKEALEDQKDIKALVEEAASFSGISKTDNWGKF